MSQEEHFDLVNELTINRIQAKLDSKGITRANLNEKLREKYGDVYYYARNINKRSKSKEIKQKWESVKENREVYSDKKNLDYMFSLFDSNNKFDSNKNYVELNEVYTDFSYMKNNVFRKLLSNIKTKDTFDIFLSHSYKDKYYVYGVYLILTEDYGLKVYIDWIVDPFLSETRSKVAIRNIRILQIRMSQSQNFSLLKTANFKESKWIAWETGYFNGKSDNVFIQLLGGKDIDDDTSGFGFLKIYRRLYIIDGKLKFLEDGVLSDFDFKRW
jgi:hypothetical protein